jgi:hypothetical protein
MHCGIVPVLLMLLLLMLLMLCVLMLLLLGLMLVMMLGWRGLGRSLVLIVRRGPVFGIGTSPVLCPESRGTSLVLLVRRVRLLFGIG